MNAKGKVGDVEDVEVGRDSEFVDELLRQAAADKAARIDPKVLEENERMKRDLKRAEKERGETKLQLKEGEMQLKDLSVHKTMLTRELEGLRKELELEKKKEKSFAEEKSVKSEKEEEEEKAAKAKLDQRIAELEKREEDVKKQKGEAEEALKQAKAMNENLEEERKGLTRAQEALGEEQKALQVRYMSLMMVSLISISIFL